MTVKVSNVGWLIYMLLYSRVPFMSSISEIRLFIGDQMRVADQLDEQ